MLAVEDNMNPTAAEESFGRENIHRAALAIAVLSNALVVLQQASCSCG